MFGSWLFGRFVFRGGWWFCIKIDVSGIIVFFSEYLIFCGEVGKIVVGLGGY